VVVQPPKGSRHTVGIDSICPIMGAVRNKSSRLGITRTARDNSSTSSTRTINKCHIWRNIEIAVNGTCSETTSVCVLVDIRRASVWMVQTSSDTVTLSVDSIGGFCQRNSVCDTSNVEASMVSSTSSSPSSWIIRDGSGDDILANGSVMTRSKCNRAGNEEENGKNSRGTHLSGGRRVSERGREKNARRTPSPPSFFIDVEVVLSLP